jgi:hypothetical protein
MPRGRKKKPENNYFNEEVELAVCQYKNSDNYAERERAFRIVYPAFSKIAEVMLNKMKISYYDTSKEDLQADAVSFMVEKLPKFDCGAGKKAFSYFTVVCKHYLIYVNNKNYKHIQQFNHMGEWDDSEFDIMDTSIIETEQHYEYQRLLSGFTTYLETNLNQLFKNKKQQEVAVTLLNLLNDWDDIEKISERNIHNILYERTNVGHRQNYKRLFNIISSQYTLFKNRWLSGDESFDIIKKNKLSEDDIKYIRLNYKPQSRAGGVVGLAKQLGVRYELVQKYMKDNQLI